MLNLNSANDYSMTFPHHLAAADQQFYNFYSNVPSAAAIKDKSEFSYKNQKLDFINNNSIENFANSPKDSENSKRFSVNNLLKSPSDVAEKLSGKQTAVTKRASEAIKRISDNFVAFKNEFVFIKIFCFDDNFVH